MSKSKAYTFKQDENTQEIHIYEGEFSSTTKCSSNQKSICKDANKTTGHNLKSAICLNEDQARYKAAEIGRNVCGVCVSHLYTTYKKSSK